MRKKTTNRVYPPFNEPRFPRSSNDTSNCSSPSSTDLRINKNQNEENDVKTTAEGYVACCHTCWICEVPLLPSYEEIYRSLRSNPSSSSCLYKCYPHPFLAFLSTSSSLGCTAVKGSSSSCVCAVCADRVLSLEQDVLSLTEEKAESDGCSLCGKRIQQQDIEEEEGEQQQKGEEDDLYKRQLSEKEMGAYFEDEEEEETLLMLCDTCPRAFCVKCWKRYKPTFQDISEPLQCPICCDSGSEMQPREEKPKAASPAELLDVNTLSYLLEAYEVELIEVENHRTIIHLVNKREEIFQELLMASSEESFKNVDTGKISWEAQQDLIFYRKLWEHHAIRLQAEIPVLQELLEIAGGSLQEFYQEFQRVKESLFPEERKPFWSNASEEKANSEASLSLKFRDPTINNFHNGNHAASIFIGASGYKARNERIYELDLYPSSSEDEEEIDDDRYLIEDIQSLSDALDATNNMKIHPCWREQRSPPKENMFRKALKEEDSRKQKKAYTKYSHNDDSASDEMDRMRMVVRRQCIEDEDGGVEEEDGEPALVLQVRQCKERRLRAIHKQSTNTRHSLRSLKRKRIITNDRQDGDDSVTAEQKGKIKRSKNRTTIISTTSIIPSSSRQIDDVETGNQNCARDDAKCSSSLNSYLESEFCLYDPDSNVIDATQSFDHSKSQPLQSLLKQKVTVSEPIAKQLKDHQKEGIQFMWDNMCGTQQDVHGCILAHNMGLGKSLQTIAFIHTLLTHPAIVTPDKKCPCPSQIENLVPNNRLIRTVLLLAPVNTLSNWENEFIMWVQSSFEPCSSLKPCSGVPQIPVYPLYRQTNDQRRKMIEKWYLSGGVLLTSPQKFANIACEVSEALLKEALLCPGPDLMVVDEAHAVFNKKDKKINPIISSVCAPRRIALTGTPFQNNLDEYYVMADWVRPGCLKSSAEFKRDYVKPIMDGLKADSSEDQKRRQEELIYALYNIFRPFVHRKDSTILQQDLPLLQQTVIVVRQSRLQQRILQLHKKHQALTTKNFLDAYSKLKPVFNHPGTLVLRRPTAPSHKACHEDLPAKPISSLSFTPPEPIVVQHQKAAQQLNPVADEIGEAVPKPDEMENRTEYGEVENASSRAEVRLECNKDITCVSGGEANQQVTVPSAQVKKEQIELTSSDCQAGGTSASGKGNDEEIIYILDSDDEEAAEENTQNSSSLVESQWWSDVLRTFQDISDIEHGGKIILLMQILAHADDIGEKVVVFSHSLQTLDFIEKLLNQKEWESRIPAIKRISPGKTWGPWKKNFDYVRIDGGTMASTRGELVTQFNDDNGSKSDFQLKLFLLSSKAGGIGINLVAATRVIIMDPHFNPAVDLQALYRCYRYGQTKPVFVYRLLCEGTMEEKVYRRQVNKTSLSKRLIDQNNPARHFTSRELDDLAQVDLWVQCDACDKWRMLHPCMQDEVIPDKWYCSMNSHDPDRSSCAAKERDERWYTRYFFDQCSETVAEEMHNETQSEEKEIQTKRDTILCRILSAQRGELMRQRLPGRTVNNWLSKYHFHDALLKDDPAFSRVWCPSSRECTPARQIECSTNINPQCTSIPVVSSCRGDNLACGNTLPFTPIRSASAASSNLCKEASHFKETPAKTEPFSCIMKNNGLLDGRISPMSATKSVIEILSSDEEGYDSDFEILN